MRDGAAAVRASVDQACGRGPRSARFGFVRVDRKRFVVASARVGDVTGAAACAASAPGIDDVEHQRGLHACGRMQRGGRRPRSVAHARHRCAGHAGGVQRHFEFIAGICACGGISNARNSRIPRRPVAVSGEYSLSMQNSARWVLPVRSTSRLRSRRSTSHGASASLPDCWRCVICRNAVSSS